MCYVCCGSHPSSSGKPIKPMEMCSIISLYSLGCLLCLGCWLAGSPAGIPSLCGLLSINGAIIIKKNETPKRFLANAFFQSIWTYWQQQQQTTKHVYAVRNQQLFIPSSANAENERWHNITTRTTHKGVFVWRRRVFSENPNQPTNQPTSLGCPKHVFCFALLFQPIMMISSAQSIIEPGELSVVCCVYVWLDEITFRKKYARERPQTPHIQPIQHPTTNQAPANITREDVGCWRCGWGEKIVFKIEKEKSRI